ncbi:MULTISPECIES: NRDE family protein [unclassified Microbacterium]|uniref:NRDE family protein n=1 Tax=unclassified Microbacterium TaxID=2609290 RepID=UPI001FCEE377|nr:MULTISPECIES: NRDE family protein [unclassified Microbacterium]
MCTVVIDVENAGSARLLAVRDEDPLRAWDSLGAWWPEDYPGVIGIRDRRAGGAWLAANPGERRLAVLLNRADVRDLPDGRAVSRGALALESVKGRSPIAPLSMHGFNLLEVGPDGARVLSWDGVELRETRIAPGTHMIAHDDLDDATTPRIEAWLPEFRALGPTADSPDWTAEWTALLASSAALPQKTTGRSSATTARTATRRSHCCTASPPSPPRASRCATSPSPRPRTGAGSRGGSRPDQAAGTDDSSAHENRAR